MEKKLKGLSFARIPHKDIFFEMLYDETIIVWVIKLYCKNSFPLSRYIVMRLIYIYVLKMFKVKFVLGKLVFK